MTIPFPVSATIIVLFPAVLRAQPFIDIAQVNLYADPDAVQRSEFSATLPLPLDSSERRLIVLDPYHIRWSTWTAAEHYPPAGDARVREEMAGSGMALTYVTPLRGPWSLAVAGIARYHWLETTDRGDWQGGGAGLAIRKVNDDLTLRAGVYANDDAFGWFVIPLVGVHWRIAPGRTLFGILPGSLNFEQRISRRVRCGLSFRAYTTSFGSRDGDYRRIDENPVGLFADLYVTRHLVLRGEAGYSAFRQIRGGEKDPCVNFIDRWGYVDHGIGDGVYARVVLAFRMRLDDDR